MLSEVINEFALSIILVSRPSFLLISKALLFPGIPNNNLYVGFKLIKSNSELAFSKPLSY